MKEVVKGSNTKIRSSHNVNEIKRYSNIMTSKKLNLFGKLSIIGIYTLVVVFIASFQIRKNIESDINRTLSSLKEDQLQTKTLIKGELKKISKDLQYSTTNFNIEEKILNRVNTTLFKEKQKESLNLKNQQEQIDLLKRKIQALITLSKNNTLKNNKDEEDLKTLSYSQENYDILYFKHQQVLKRMKENNKKQEIAFVSLNDMTQKENQIRLQDLKDSLALQLYSKRRKFTTIRQTFRKNKFINIASNF